jgi:serine/threonine-protein kinase RsbW
MNYSYKVPCSKNQLQCIRNFIHQTLDKFAISDIDKCQLVLAVDEVCTNLMIHSHNCNAKETLELIINVKDDQGITFEILDQGKAFNMLEYSEPKLDEIVQARRKGGLGIILVKRIMDQIEFDHDVENNRNICRLYKKINIQLLAKKNK